MPPSSLPPDDPPPRPLPQRPRRRMLLVGGLSLCGGLGIAVLLLLSRSPTVPTPADVSPQPGAPEPPGLLFTAPTPQTRWQAVEDPTVYMPTGSGRVVSAAFGSVRTNARGQASFHEGVDIAPTQWKQGRATDRIFAVADGQVAYINRAPGNSSYGIYVVLNHEDPVGTLVTLYAHLASVPSSLRNGQTVRRGQVIGTMGHTSTLGIPRQRSHLHFEMGLRLNADFSGYYRDQRKNNPHGNDHGFNIAGFDPRRMLQPLEEQSPAHFSALQTLRRHPPAWRILIRTSERPNFFARHPALWEGPLNSPIRGVVLDVSISGLPLWGRAARTEELEASGDAVFRILGVNEAVLGRNGMRHVIRNSSGWTLGTNGKRWLDILLYGSG